MKSGKQNAARPLRVIVLSPPIDKSGGIGTLFRYARDNFPDDVKVEFIDTRGYSSNPWASLLTLMRAVALVTWRRITGNVDVIHLNLGARGAAIRKLTLATWITYVLRVPFVLQLHAATFGEFAASLPRSIRMAMIAVMNRAERILVLGQVWRNLLIDLGCKASKVQVFVMGVPDLSTDARQQKDDSAAQDSNYSILFAGEMSERKGLPYLLEALAQPAASRVRLIAAGSGDLKAWRALSKEAGVDDRVALLGLVNPELIHTLMTLVDAIILPSNAEGLPVSVLEALSSGALAICTPAGSLSEFITDGSNAIILESQSPQHIAEGLNRAIEIANASDISTQARHLWSSKFDARLTTRELVGIWADTSKAN